MKSPEKFLDLKSVFDSLVASGFNPVRYEISGRSFIVFNPEEESYELFTCPSSRPLGDAMLWIEADLKFHLLRTKQFEYIKVHWISFIPDLDEGVEIADDTEHECKYCSCTIPPFHSYWTFYADMDDPLSDYLTYCSDCVRQRVAQRAIEDFFKENE